MTPHSPRDPAPPVLQALGLPGVSRVRALPFTTQPRFAQTFTSPKAADFHTVGRFGKVTQSLEKLRGQ